jgi:ABC-type Fe3+/spermidine/putrescine transport system ATPase subunit/ABC-type sulfate transport system permease component
MTWRPSAPLPWLAGLLAVYLISPFVVGIPQVWSADWHSVDVKALGQACAVSVASATLASALIAVGGIPLGYLLARVPGRATGVLGFLVQLPLALPPLASGVLLLFLLGRTSPLGRLSYGALTDSFVGIVLAEMFVAAPFLIVAARSGFEAVDPMLEGVAATLGHGPLSIFLKVSLPLAWPTTRSGLLLTWLRGFGEFGATVMVAYHPYSLPVYTYVAFGSQGLPTMLPVILPALGAALLLMAISNVSTRTTRNGRVAAVLTPGWVQPLEESHRDRQSRNDIKCPMDLAFRKQLNGFNLDVSWSTHARRLAILGPSGSGKSLTMRLIAGLESPDSGRLQLGDRDLSRCAPELRTIAYVPQNYCLFPHLNIAQQVRFPIGADPELAQRWLRRLGLDNLTDRIPAELSLGQQQRVALARALVRPSLLMLLDEPFSALDTPLRVRLRRELRELQNEMAMTTIVVTHDPAEAAMLADEMLVLNHGRVLQAGPVEELYRRPASEVVARLLGAENVNDGMAVAEDRIAIGNGCDLVVSGPALRAGEHVGWSVRADRVRLHDTGRYEARIENIVVMAGDCEISVRLGRNSLRILADPGTGVRPGPCRLDIDPGSVQVWRAEGQANDGAPIGAIRK